MAEIIKEENFDEVVLKSDKTVLVDFFATWCGPCRMLAPILDELTDEVADTVKIVKVDVDEANDLAARYGIMSIPTMLVFKNGEVVNKVIGLKKKSELRELLGQ